MFVALLSIVEKRSATSLSLSSKQESRNIACLCLGVCEKEREVEGERGCKTQ